MREIVLASLPSRLFICGSVFNQSSIMNATDQPAALAALADFLFNRALENGEPIDPRDLATVAEEWRKDNFAGYVSRETAEQANRRATERFVDSMVQNEHDTEKEGRTDLAPLAARIARWEALRPETDQAAAPSADQLAAIAGRKAAEALEAYAAALAAAAEVEEKNGNPYCSHRRDCAAAAHRTLADSLRDEVARLS